MTSVLKKQRNIITTSKIIISKSGQYCQYRPNDIKQLLPNSSKKKESNYLISSYISAYFSLSVRLSESRVEYFLSWHILQSNVGFLIHISYQVTCDRSYWLQLAALILYKPSLWQSPWFKYRTINIWLLQEIRQKIILDNEIIVWNISTL